MDTLLWQNYYTAWLKTYYRYTQNDIRSVQHMEAALAELAPALHDLWPTHTLKLLELGVGDGAMLQAVQRHLEYATVLFGIDIQLQAIERARERLGGEATLVAADLFTTDIPKLVPGAMPPDILVMSHIIYFATSGTRRYESHYAKLVTFVDILKALEHTIGPCISSSTVGMVLHLAPLSRYLHVAFLLYGFRSYRLSTRIYKIRYPRLTDAQWECLENGRVSSLEEVPPEQRAAQDLQHLIEINSQMPLHAMSPVARRKKLRSWRKTLTRDDYYVTRSESLTIVTRRGAHPSLWQAMTARRIRTAPRTYIVP